MTQRLLPLFIFAAVMAASRSSRAYRRSGSCCWTISASPRWWRWGSCCSPASAASPRSVGQRSAASAPIRRQYGHGLRHAPWLTFRSLLVSGIAARCCLASSRCVCQAIVAAWHHRLGHRAVLFQQLEFLGRNDGIPGFRRLSIGSLKMLKPRHDLPIWIAVAISAHLTAESAGLPHRPRDRARSEPYRAEAFGVQTPRTIAGLHLCGGAGRLVRLALRPFSARRQSGAVRRAGQHRISLHRRGRGRRLCLQGGGVLGAGIVVITEEILRSYLPYIFGGEADWNHRVRHPADAAPAATGADRRLAVMARLPFRPGSRKPDSSLTLPPRGDRQALSTCYCDQAQLDSAA